MFARFRFRSPSLLSLALALALATALTGLVACAPAEDTVAAPTSLPGEGPDALGAETASTDAAAGQVREPGTTVPEPTATADAGPTPAPRKPQFVVHEWGTFTSMQTSAGQTLVGMHHEDEALPGFVYSRAQEYLNTQKGIEDLPEPVDQKMETPVLYFYSEQVRDVQVTVGFPKGVIGQWFPAAAGFQPALGSLGAIAGGEMTWAVQVDPALDMAKAPPVAPDDIWAPSRNVAATPLQVNGEVEKFIFYRGLGRFELPVRVTADAAGQVTVHNDSADALPAVFLLRAAADGGAVVPVGALAAGQQQVVTLPPSHAPLATYLEQARKALQGALVASGLYADESWAMVDTWSHSYFQTPGLRVLYVLPRPWTDALLPLQVTPVPDAVARTLVGRIEVLTPAAEAEMLAWVEASHAKQSLQGLETLGRFVEPKLRRAKQLATSPAVQAWCDKLIEQAALLP